MGAEATLKMLLLGEDRSAGKTMDGVGDKAQGLIGHLKGVGKIASGVFAGEALYDGAKEAGRALFEMGKNAMEDAAAARRLSVALHNTTGATDKQVASVENWISKQGVALGVTDDELRPALQRLAQSTGDITKAQHLASLAMDVSAGSGKSLKTVSEALAKANAGNMGALSRLGVRIKDTEGKTMSFNEVTKEMAKTFGGQAAAAADSAQGKFDRLKLIFDETKESIGYKLIPVASALATLLLTKVGPGIGDVSSWLNAHLVPALAQAGQWAGQHLLPILHDLAHWVMDVLVPAIRDFAQKALAGASEAINNVKGHLSNLEPYIRLVMAAWHGVANVLTQFILPVLGDLVKVLLPAIGWALGKIIDVLGALGRAGIWMWNNALGPVLKFLAHAIGVALDLFGEMFQALGHVPGFGWAKDLGDTLKSAADHAHDLASGIKDIPDHKKVSVDITETHIVKTVGGVPIVKPSSHAVGTSFFSGGWTWVGERGRELVQLPRGSSITPEGRLGSVASGGDDLGTLTVVVKTDSGEVIEQRLVKLKRTRGGASLAFV